MTETTDSRNPEIDVDMVVDYLERHPNLLLERPELLESINLEHQVEGAASLVKRQVAQLRERNRALLDQLGALIDNARSNERLMTALFDLTLAISRAPDLGAQLRLLERELCDTFNADEVRLMLRTAAACGPLPDWVTVVTELPEWRTELAVGAVSCGGEQNRSRAHELGGTLQGDTSWALALLSGRTDADDMHGLLALGSADPHRFSSDMSTDFLVQLGRMIGGLLKLPGAAIAASP